MHMEKRTRLSRCKALSLEKLLKTLDRFSLMHPYVITAEMKPRTYLNKLSSVEYEEPEKVYGIVIRIINKEGIILRITIDEEN